MAQRGGYLTLALGGSTVRYPIPERIFEYVSTVRSRRLGCATRGHPRIVEFSAGCARGIGRVLTVKTIARIRRAFLVDHKPVRKTLREKEDLTCTEV